MFCLLGASETRSNGLSELIATVRPDYAEPERAGRATATGWDRALDEMPARRPVGGRGLTRLPRSREAPTPRDERRSGRHATYGGFVCAGAQSRVIRTHEPGCGRPLLAL
jgi:hypothetical protein